MADQKRWFKVWVSILDDPHFQELSLEDIGRWTLLGAMTAFVGSAGHLASPNGSRRLREVLRVESEKGLREAIERLPSVVIEEGKKRDDELSVTWQNWHKYQKDATAAQRMESLRSKRRGDENKNKTRREQEEKKSHVVLADDQFIATLRANGAYQGIDIDRELGRMDAWLLTPKGRGRKKTRRFVVNWLNRIDRPMAGTADGPHGIWQ